MDREVINARLEGLRHCVQRIRDNTPASADSLRQNEDLQDIVSINLERAVQMCVDIAAHLVAESDGTAPPPETMGESFDALQSLGVLDAQLATRLRKAVGFRNIAIHAYQAVDWNIVYSIITTRLEDFCQFASRVAELLESSPD